MTKAAAKKLAPGIYRLHWKGGGTSSAAVGHLYEGGAWFAPANWTNPDPQGIASVDWRLVHAAQMISGPR